METTLKATKDEGTLLRVVELVKRYGRTVAVDGVSLTVGEGEIVGFVGPNGAGKTTTMRSVMGLLRPDSGRIYLFGELLETRNAGRLLKNVGYVPGEVKNYGDTTVLKILQFYASFYDNFDWDYCETLCEKLGVEMTKKFEDLSLGNKKKLGIVLAFAHKPRLYLLDEPTNSLDPVVQRKLYNLLSEVKSQGAGVLFSSHVLQEVDRISDRVVFIKAGRIVTPSNFRRTAKKVTVKFVSDDAALIEEIVRSDAFQILRMEGDSLTFLYDGQILNLLDLLAKLRPVDALIEPVSLEDVFENVYNFQRWT